MDSRDLVCFPFGVLKLIVSSLNNIKIKLSFTPDF